MATDESIEILAISKEKSVLMVVELKKGRVSEKKSR